MQLTIVKARELMQKHPEYRFGQALWNCLPIKYQKAWVNTTYDFYYEVDEKKVLDTFMEACANESSPTSEEER